MKEKTTETTAEAEQVVGWLAVGFSARDRHQCGGRLAPSSSTPLCCFYFFLFLLYSLYIFLLHPSDNPVLRSIHIFFFHSFIVLFVDH